MTEEGKPARPFEAPAGISVIIGKLTTFAVDNSGQKFPIASIVNCYLILVPFSGINFSAFDNKQGNGADT